MMPTNYEQDYKSLLIRMLNEGSLVRTRTGPVCRLLNVQLKVNLEDGFPVLTGRKMFFSTVKGEADWMLSGSTNVIDLHKKGIHIWDKWADPEGELGPTYGAQLIKQWHGVADKIKSDPSSRRNLISLWSVDEISEMALPPCYYSMQFYVDNKRLCMTANARSSDAAVGLPYDIAVLAYLLHEMCRLTYKDVGYLVFNAVDCHINSENYSSIFEYLSSKTYHLPRLEEGELVDYVCGPYVKMIVKV